MIKKVALILTLMVVGLLAVASVCASDVNDTVVATEDKSEEVLNLENQDASDVVSVDNECDVVDVSEVGDNILSTERVVSKKTFNDIQTVINSASTNDVIKLSGTYYGSGKKITIGKSITLRGDGETILDAKGLSSILEINSNKVTIENIKFINGYSNGIAGGVYCGGEYVTLKNCVFSDNTAKNRGGHIYWTGNFGKIDGCTFTGNDIYGMTYRTDIINSKFIASSINGEFNDHVINGCTFIDYPSYYSWSNSVNCKFYDSTSIQASKVTATYSVSKKLVLTLKDGKGNLLKDKYVTIKVGTISKKIITNSNGQASVEISGLVPKTYTASIQFEGDSKYVASSKKADVIVKKATPKLTAKAKTFKKSVKTKNFVVTLKTNQNKVMKNTKVTLKVNGKTYSAKTNAKGQATFKINNLNKKGKFTAAVKFAGNKYYNAKTAKPKIIVK